MKFIQNKIKNYGDLKNGDLFIPFYNGKNGDQDIYIKLHNNEYFPKFNMLNFNKLSFECMGNNLEPIIPVKNCSLKSIYKGYCSFNELKNGQFFSLSKRLNKVKEGSNLFWSLDCFCIKVFENSYIDFKGCKPIILREIKLKENLMVSLIDIEEMEVS